ncbi:cytochrome c biogenesis protein CcsA [Poriferisphaera sp. WC338]|uniref:cytochrome c biogenesis protein CcsA n=1 Tax=Poriferisphaera sp. WC338 TaxID=3425129 RepID=UPI003D8166AF
MVILTLFTLTAWILDLRTFGQPKPDINKPVTTLTKTKRVFLILITILAAALFIIQLAFGNSPGLSATHLLTSHADGLLLIAAILAPIILIIQYNARLRGLTTFALPILAFIFAWAICATTWSYRTFNFEDVHSVWLAIHLLFVYLGTLCAFFAAITAGMYLFIQSRLKHKHALSSLGQLASLEALEKTIIVSATAGFALFTIGLVTGLVILTTAPLTLTTTWWLYPKIILAVIAWLAYALLMNLRYATSFRGKRAAWIAILGLLLILSIYGIVTALPEHKKQPAAESQSITQTHHVSNHQLGGL